MIASASADISQMNVGNDMNDQKSTLSATNPFDAATSRPSSPQSIDFVTGFASLSIAEPSSEQRVSAEVMYDGITPFTSTETRISGGNLLLAHRIEQPAGDRAR